VDTRAITVALRDTGCLNGIITDDASLSDEELIARTKEWSILGKDLISEVTCTEPYEWKDPTGAEWEFSAAALNTNGNGAGPYHVRPWLCTKTRMLAAGRGCKGVFLCFGGTVDVGVCVCVCVCVCACACACACVRVRKCARAWVRTWMHAGVLLLLKYQNVVLQIVAYDFGIKHNILRRLASFGCRITVVPASYPAEKVLAMNPDGVFFSNGPVCF
jgi:carbamoylphosphate synthase small subunit